MIENEFFSPGKFWGKAVELARIISPDQVVGLEEEWGDHLSENKQMDAAISHYIEAGCTKKALDAAVSARQWKKAVHIVQVLDDSVEVRGYYKQIGTYYASIKVSYSILQDIQIKGKIVKMLPLLNVRISGLISFIETILFWELIEELSLVPCHQIHVFRTTPQLR